MRYISCKLDDLKKIVLPIGYEGENEHTRVQVDAGEVFKEYPAAVPSLKVHGPTGAIYPAEVTRDGKNVIWDIKASDCAADGSGEAQFTFTLNNVIVKSCIAKIKVYRSIVGGSTPPDPVQDWLDEAQDVLDDLEAAEVHQPMIGVDGYWYTWDQENEEYTKTETKAQGEDGQQGPAGQDGAPGQDATPALITVNYSDLTFPVAKDTQCYHDGLLYYAKQDIQTSEAWTAAHWQQTTVEEQQRLLLNAIRGVTPDAQQSDIGKALILKTIDQTGKPTAFEYGEAGGGSVDPSVVEQKVDEWLDENITNPDSPPLDRSLSSDSAAAPADMLGVVDGELDMQDTTVDLLALATLSTGYKLDGDGNKASSGNNDVYEIAYDGSYSKFSATLYSNTNYQMKAISFQNAQGAVISTLEYPTTSGASTFTDQAIPSGTAKILLNNRRSSGTPACTCTSKYSKRLSDDEEDIAEINNKISVFPVGSKNLFDKSKEVVGLVYESDGTIKDTYTDHRSSDYIEIEPNTIYTVSGYNKNNGRFAIDGLRYAFYTSNKTFISGVKTEGHHSTFRTPSTAAYIRFSMDASKAEKWQLERRAFATKYVPYNAIAADDESDEMFFNFPAKTFATTGLEYNLYLFNVRPDRFEGEFKSRYVIATNTKMHRYGRFLRLESNNTSTNDIQINASAESKTKCGHKIFNVITKNPANLSEASVLILGDSTTANGYVAQYLYEFGGENHLIETLGTLGTAPYKHEGRSGWRLYDYFHTSENNPFYNPSTETFDAAYYFTQTGVSLPDVFIINLGINDMHYDSGSLYDAKNHAADYIQMVNDVITSVKGVSSSIKVAICLTTPPNTDPYSFGIAGTNIIGYDDYRIANLVLCEALIDEYDYRESEGIYLIPINACLDTKYNMPTSTQHPNSRSDLDLTLPTNAANVHPNTAGYHQIADEMYAFICSLYVT